MISFRLLYEGAILSLFHPLGSKAWIPDMRGRLESTKEKGLADLGRFVQDEGYNFLKDYFDAVVAGPSGTQE